MHRLFPTSRKAMAIPKNPMITKGQSTTLVNDSGRMINKINDPIQVTLIEKEELATDTYVYRFALPEEDMTLGHLTCEYL